MTIVAAGKIFNAKNGLVPLYLLGIPTYKDTGAVAPSELGYASITNMKILFLRPKPICPHENHEYSNYLFEFAPFKRKS